MSQAGPQGVVTCPYVAPGRAIHFTNTHRRLFKKLMSPPSALHTRHYHIFHKTYKFAKQWRPYIMSVIFAQNFVTINHVANSALKTLLQQTLKLLSRFFSFSFKNVLFSLSLPCNLKVCNDCTQKCQHSHAYFKFASSR